MDVSITGFFSAFPVLEEFNIDQNYNVEGNFVNLDAISTNYLPNLQQLELESNKFSGSVSLSHGLFLSSSITDFILAHNNFAGAIQWDIFSNLPLLEKFDIGSNSFNGTVSLTTMPSSLYRFKLDNNNFTGEFPWQAFATATGLYELVINDNLFTGNINWTIISHLHNNGRLSAINMRNNSFTGYADFSWISDRSWWLDWLYLDIDIPCMFHSFLCKSPCLHF